METRTVEQYKDRKMISKLHHALNMDNFQRVSYSYYLLQVLANFTFIADLFSEKPNVAACHGAEVFQDSCHFGISYSFPLLWVLCKTNKKNT